METEISFNAGVYGTTGWAKFGVPMTAGSNTGKISEFNKRLDGVIDYVKANSKDASPQYLATLNCLAVQFHSIGELVLDGKATI
jgi:hypothetical protein